MAEEAHSLSVLDMSAAKAALDEANNAVNAAVDEVAKAEAQIAVETAEELIKALS